MYCRKTVEEDSVLGRWEWLILLEFFERLSNMRIENCLLDLVKRRFFVS